MPRAPISGLAVSFREPTGHDDLLLLERTPDLGLAVDIVARLASGADGGPLDVAALPAGDIDALVVELRRRALGDTLVAEGGCGACVRAVDVDFDLAAFLAHHRPRATRLAEPGEEPGWWRLRRSGTAFRVPSAADVLASADAAELRARCLPGEPSARDARDAERAMEALAPTLCATGVGECPECGAEIAVEVDARTLCLEELRFLGSAVLEDVHALASAYHWSERAILDLPSARRALYAELVAAGGARTASLELVDG